MSYLVAMLRQFLSLLDSRSKRLRSVYFWRLRVADARRLLWAGMNRVEVGPGNFLANGIGPQGVCALDRDAFREPRSRKHVGFEQ